MQATRGEPAVAPTAGSAPDRGARGALVQLRLALVALAVAVALLLALLAAYKLAAARVPQHRAALEELIRYQTGLEVRFTGLALRWGWYGPEALFQEVELGEPHGAGLRLRARRLIVSLDAWQMLRSGHLEARRITLEDPNVDLLGTTPARAATATHSSVQLSDAGTRILAHWRGGEIEVSGGTLRTLLPGGTDAVTFGISHAELRRRDADWSAEAQVLLPQALGGSLHLALQLRSTPDLQDVSSATVTLEGRRLELAAWAALPAVAQHGAFLRSGRGDLQLQASFVHGRLQSASGRIAAESLGWTGALDTGTGASLGRLRGNWQLRRRGTHWQLTAKALELEPPASDSDTASAEDSRTYKPGTPLGTSLRVEFTQDGAEVRGQARHAPLASLLSLARGHLPQLPVNGLLLEGEATELSFDWNAYRAPGTRLAASAELQALALTDGSGNMELTGLSARASAAESSLSLAVHAPAARLARRESAPVEDLEIDAHIDAAVDLLGRWRLETQNLHIARQGLSLAATGVMELPAGAATPVINAHVSIKDTDAALLARLVGPGALVPRWDIAAVLASGRLESGELSWRGPLGENPWSGSGARTDGSLVLRDATLRQNGDWPEASGLSAYIDWHGPRFHARIDRARTEGFTLTEASADLDARAGHAARFAGRLAGDAERLLGWLQSHPQAATWAPGLAHLDLRGSTRFDLELALPGAAPGNAQPGSPYVRVTALLDGVEMRPAPGVPPLLDLRGPLVFAGGHLQRSALTGRWLGGPATLSVAERREQGLSVLVLSGHGLMDAQQAVQAAAGNLQDAGLNGSADWSALLTVAPGAEGVHWQLHADSSLAGIASHLAEPFDKAAGTALPLHLEWEARNEAAELHVALGSRLAAVAALTRSGDSWRIERGAVRLGGSTPALPLEPAMVLDGHVSRLDLAAGLALLRQASRDAALPALRAHLSASELKAAGRRFSDADLSAEITAGAGALRIDSPTLTGNARWPAMIDAAHPALLHVAHFNVTQPADTSIVMGAAAALSPAVQLAVDDLQWEGGSLGSFAAALGVSGESVEAGELSLSGPSAQARGKARCANSGCSLTFEFDTADVATALAVFGLAPELDAREGHLEGELHWPGTSPSLATLGGSLHMRAEEGTMGLARGQGKVPFALLSVPALLAGLRPRYDFPLASELRFARFGADYQLSDGEAVTSDLHFDGDAEILVQGRVGLVSGDYDERAWILKGEERLPDPLRRFGPGPGVAAVWLSLRDLIGSGGLDRSRSVLRLRGAWSDPIVSPE